MAARIVDRRDLSFLLHEVEVIETFLSAPRFEHLDAETLDAMLDTAQLLAEELFLPAADILDSHEPQAVNGHVKLPSQTAVALRGFADAGFCAQTFSEASGGLQLPYTVSMAINGLFSAANQAVFNYSMLSIAAAHLLESWGSNEQKSIYLAPLLQGRWFGTMCLSESQAGSSLADICTRAEPIDPGRYRIVGSKMWISAGDHDLSANIVHMLLAKIPGGPPGVKGLSLFIVPKWLPDERGNPSLTNNVTLVGLNHKMGQRGTTNCALNFGEQGETIGFLVGEPHQGIRYMFHMMNEARIGVGHGAITSSLAGYLYSLDYALERKQGRLPGQKDPLTAQVPIINHADVRRMLLAQKAIVEGGLGLVFYCSSLIDRRATNPSEADDLELMLQVLTPIAKSWPAEHGLEANNLAIQVLGGAGYIRDHPVERLYRDNRLNHIHEGAFGIQALDMLGRKVRLEQGRGLELLFAEIRKTIRSREFPELSNWAGELERLLECWQAATQSVLGCSDEQRALANATMYLDCAGTVVVGWLWLRQAAAALRGRARLQGEETEADDFYRGKLTACRYYFRYLLPATRLGFELVQSLDDTSLAMEPRYFGAHCAQTSEPR